MEWNKWNRIDIDKRIGLILGFLILLSYIFIFSYYFLAFHVFNDSFLSQSILDFNAFIMQNFPGAKSISTINEQRYGDGRFIAYMYGVNLLCIAPFVGILSIIITIKQNLWTKYSQFDELHAKDFLYSFLSYLLFGWLFISLYYDVSLHRSWQYKTFTAVMMPTGLGLYFSTIPVLLLNDLIYIFRSRFSSSKK